MLPSSPARIRGLTMAVLLKPGEHDLHVIPHVPAELEMGRPGLHQTPFLERALGQSKYLGKLTLGEKRRSDLRYRVDVHSVLR